MVVVTAIVATGTGLHVAAALSGVDMAMCLVILMFAPVVTVVGYEMRGYRHQAEAVARQDGQAAD